MLTDDLWIKKQENAFVPLWIPASNKDQNISLHVNAVAFWSITMAMIERSKHTGAQAFVKKD